MTGGRLALDGGTPVRTELLPYGRHQVSDEDVAAVTAALRSGWLTTGPAVAELEAAVARRVGCSDAVAVASGTAALHTAMAALDLGPEDEVVVPALTFAATANCVLYAGARPVFVDVDPATLLVDPDAVDAKVTRRTRAVIAVDYAGQPADYTALDRIAGDRSVTVVADACHALGGELDGRPVGSLARVSTLSFHPVKHITTGEGGMVVTDDSRLAERIRRLRNHGFSTDHHQRARAGATGYDMVELGFNYRLSDLQCALGLAQLARCDAWLERRRSLAERYDAAFEAVPGVSPLDCRDGVRHAYHLYVVRIDHPALAGQRDLVARALRAEGIGTAVHYPPVHLHSYYQRALGTGPGMCPAAERAAREILSLPMFPSMSDGDAADVIEAVSRVMAALAGR